MENLLYWIGLVAVAVNALTGVLDAGRKQMDLVGAVMVGCATALGGGTVRDVLLDRTVFWIADQTYLLVSLATALAVFFAVRGLKLPQRLFLIPDAVGLALFTIAGTQIALRPTALSVLRTSTMTTSDTIASNSPPSQTKNSSPERLAMTNVAIVIAASGKE